MESGIVFNIQKFSIHDGPGIRTNVFLKGCPLRCIWCHNPEGLEAVPEIEFAGQKCIGCGGCAVCANGCHRFTEEAGHIYIRDACIRCGRCVELCPAASLTMMGTRMTVEEVITQVMADKAFYDQSGGGMTLSGGEPLFQHAFALALLQEAKAHGLHTAVETSGFASADVFTSILPWTDLLLFDYKITGEEKHIRYTGVPQGPILANLERAEQAGVPVVLRCPLIPGINMEEEHYQAIAALADRLNTVSRVDLEPYHSLGTGKTERLGKAAGFVTEMPDKDKIREICDHIQSMCRKEITVS